MFVVRLHKPFAREPWLDRSPRAGSLVWSVLLIPRRIALLENVTELSLIAIGRYHKWFVERFCKRIIPSPGWLAEVAAKFVLGRSRCSMPKFSKAVNLFGRTVVSIVFSHVSFEWWCHIVKQMRNSRISYGKALVSWSHATIVFSKKHILPGFEKSDFFAQTCRFRAFPYIFVLALPGAARCAFASSNGRGMTRRVILPKSNTVTGVIGRRHG